MNTGDAVSLPTKLEVQEFRVFNPKLNINDNVLNVAYGVDENYLFGVGISMASVILNNQNDVAFHIICDEYPEDFLQKSELLANEHNISISLYKINVKSLEALPSTKLWSKAMYFRLFAFDFLQPKIEKLLYLDADVICKGSLKELVDVDLTKKIAAVVKDVESIQKDVGKRLPEYNIDGEYFNSGVILMNLNKWVSHEFTQKALILLTQKEEGKAFFKYPDQDVLNILLLKKVIFLPQDYNTIYTIKSELKDKTHRKYLNVINNNTKLIHYTGATKPWHSWANYPSVDFYRKALLISPWKNSPAKQATSLIEQKKRYKHLFVQRHYLKGIIAGTIYFIRKNLSS